VDARQAFDMPGGNARGLLSGVLLAGALLFPAPGALAQPPAAAPSSLGSDSMDQRRAAAAALSSPGSAGSDAVDTIAEQLGALRRGGGTAASSDRADAALLNLMTDPRLRGARPMDAVEFLVQQKPDLTVERALATVCMMRALSRIGTMQAVQQLVLTASDAGGAFRPELFRELRQLDERASAALIEARGSRSADVRAWAKDALEALGKRTPGDTVQTTDDQVLADVLRAYAAVRDVDAVPVVMSFINSDRVQVRAASREATLAYGPDALGKLRATYQALTGERLPEDVEATTAANKLFDAYDHQRLSDVYARLDEGLAKQKAGNVDAAIAAFDDVLARQPLLDRGAEIAPAYVSYAEGLEQSDRPRARDYLRKALRLSGSTAASSPVRSEILYLDGEDLVARGLADTKPFEEALALDPDNARARDRLGQLRADAVWRHRREDRIAATVGGIGLSLVLLAVLRLLKKHL
jgi:tetratricopeptide (TPR) repeat protein